MPRTIRSPRQVRLVELLVEARRKAGITQTDLASRLGLVQSVVSLIERGGRRIDLVELMEFADAVGLDIHGVIDELRQLPR